MKKLLLLFTFLLAVSFNQYISAQERYLDNIFEAVDIQSDIVYGNNVTVFPTLLGQSPTTQDLLMDINNYPYLRYLANYCDITN